MTNYKPRITYCIIFKLHFFSIPVSEMYTAITKLCYLVTSK